MKKCLITGINGFAGSYLAELLLERGHSVAGTYITEEFSNIGAIRERVQLFRADILDAGRIHEIIASVKPSYIFHLAALASVAASFSNSELTMKVNVEGTRNVFSAARLPSTEKILLTCSADEYGTVREDEIPIREDHPLNPSNPYAESKMMAERLAGEFVSEGVPVVISRSFNHTGPRQSPEFVASDWARQVALIEKGKQEPVINVGNLDVKRDFADVRDVVRAYLALAERGVPGEAYNVCSGRCYGLRELLDMIAGFSRVKIIVKRDAQKFRPADNPIYCGDYSKIKRLGWTPGINIRTTLGDLVSYWREKA